MTTTDDHPSAPALRVFAEDWDPSYGAPATFDWDDSGSVERVEDGAGHVAGHVDARLPLAFVDGVRRAELRLWAEDGRGVRIPGLAGAYAVGAVTVRPGVGAEFSGERVGRLAVWGRGHHGDLAGSHGFRWASASTTVDEPDELLLQLHERMRRAEGTLALAAADAGWHTVLDGPLNRIPGVHGLVTGYVKTHRRQLLPDDEHARVPTLAVGERTRLYTNGPTHYTCYVRVGAPGPAALVVVGHRPAALPGRRRARRRRRRGRRPGRHTPGVRRRGPPRSSGAGQPDAGPQPRAPPHPRPGQRPPRSTGGAGRAPAGGRPMTDTTTDLPRRTDRRDRATQPRSPRGPHRS